MHVHRQHDIFSIMIFCLAQNKLKPMYKISKCVLIFDSLSSKATKLSNNEKSELSF